MGSGDTNNILGIRAQITANLGIIVKDTPIKILTIRAEGGYQAIVLDSKNNNVVITNANKDATNYKQEESVAEALDSLLGLSSEMVLDKLRSDKNDLVVPKELPPLDSTPSFDSLPQDNVTGGLSRGSINGRSSGGDATNPGHGGKNTIGGCGRSIRPSGSDSTSGPPRSNLSGGNLPGGSAEGKVEDIRAQVESNIKEYNSICSALISLPISSIESVAEQYLKSQLRRNKMEYRRFHEAAGGTPRTDIPEGPSRLEFELGPSERWKRDMDPTKPYKGAFRNKKATGGLFGDLDVAKPASIDGTTGGLFGGSDTGASRSGVPGSKPIDMYASDDGFTARIRRGQEQMKKNPAAFENINSSGGLFGGKETGASKSGLPGSKPIDMNTSDDGFTARIRRGQEKIKKNPAAFENSNSSGGLFGDSTAYAKSAAEAKITGGHFGTNQTPTTHTEDSASGFESNFGDSAARARSQERYPRSGLFGTPIPGPRPFEQTTNDNSDFPKRWRDVADKPSIPFGSRLNPPSSDPPKKSGDIDSSQPSLFGSFGGIARTSTPTPRPFEDDSRSDRLVESIPQASAFGSSLPFSTPTDVEPSHSNHFGILGSEYPSPSPQPFQSHLPVGVLGSNSPTTSSSFALSGDVPIESRVFGSTPLVTGFGRTKVSGEPANLGRTDELFSTAVSSSSGFGDRAPPSYISDSTIGNSSSEGAYFGSPSITSGLGGSVGASLFGAFGHTADVNKGKERPDVHFSDEHRCKESDDGSEL